MACAQVMFGGHRTFGNTLMLQGRKQSSVVRLSTQQGYDNRTKGKHFERSLLSRPTVRIPSAEIDTEAAYILF